MYLPREHHLRTLGYHILSWFYRPGVVCNAQDIPGFLEVGVSKLGPDRNLVRPRPAPEPSLPEDARA
eukprot:6654768-Alexandrium_andersonii.AAC.1